MTIQLQPTHETGVTGNGDLKYNIQMAQDAAGVWFQRHIWFRCAYRGDLNPPIVDNWIVSGTGRTGPEKHYSTVEAA